MSFVALARLDDHRDAAGFGELDGVAGEIEQHLAQARGIADDFLRQPLVDEGCDLDVFAPARAAPAARRFPRPARPSANGRLQFELAGLDLGEVENFLDQRQQRFARGLRRLGVGELLGRERRVEQQIGHAENAVERRADFVADGGEEARLGAVGGFRLVARLRERAHLDFVQFPIVVGQFLDARLQRAHLVRVCALAHQHEGDDGAGGGEQRADAGAVGVGVVIRTLQADAGEEAEPAGDHRHGGDDRAAEQHQRRLVARALAQLSASESCDPDPMFRRPLIRRVFGARNVAILFPPRAARRARANVVKGALNKR